MDAATLLVPEGWKLESRVNWVAGIDGLVKLDVAVSDPSGRGVARFYPRLVFIDGVREAAIRTDQTGGAMRQFYETNLAEGKRFNGVGNEIRRQPPTPRQYLQQFVLPRLRPDLAEARDLKVVSEKDLPDYAKAVAAGVGAGSQSRASRIRVTYTPNAAGAAGSGSGSGAAAGAGAAGAEAVEEEFVCTLTATRIGAGPNSYTQWFGDADSYRAPAGKLDALLPTFAVVRGSLAPELPWFNLVQQIGQMLVNAEKDKLQRMIDDTAARMDALHAYARRAGAEVSQRIRDNFERQQKVKADQHDRFMDYVNDVQAYRNPNDGSTLKLPAGYRYAYVSNNGGVIYTNEAGYQPPADPKTSWQQLEPVK